MALTKPTMTTAVNEAATAVNEAAADVVTAVETTATPAVPTAEEQIEVAAVEAVAEAAEAPTEVAEAVPGNRAVVTSPVSGGVPSIAGNFTSAMADQGFEGLQLDAWSFPTINLPGEGFFQLAGDEDSNLGKVFRFTPESSRQRFLVKANDDKDAESFQTYDPSGRTKQDGSSSESILAQWAADSGEDNYQPIIKTYLDVVATVCETDPSAPDAEQVLGETVMISIPPSSISRFSGAMARGGKLGPVGSWEIEASVGKKVKTGSNSFYPWMFRPVKES